MKEGKYETYIKSSYYEDGTRKKKLYLLENTTDILHNFKYPSYETYYPNGKLKCSIHYVNGRRHKIDGPAYETFYPNGEPNTKRWYVNGFLYNLSKEAYGLNGPIFQAFSEEGDLECEEFYTKGEEDFYDIDEYDEDGNPFFDLSEE